MTLQEAVTLSRQAEARMESQSLLRRSDNINQVKQKNVGQYYQRHIDSQQQKYDQINQRKMGHSTTCGHCGKEAHIRELCPARMAVCRHCNKIGHYKSVCRSQRVSLRSEDFTTTRGRPIHELSTLEEEDNIGYLGHVFQISDDDYWTAHILVNNRPIKFKLDTGATVSVIGEDMTGHHKVYKTNKRLKGAGNNDLKVMGYINATLTYKENEIQEKLFILKDQKYPLLGRLACSKLKLISRVDHIHDKPDFIKEFPDLFKGLGKLETPYEISLTPDARPTCIFAPRKIPHPLKPKVKEEIDKMINQGIISPVTEPTTWCSGIVVVPKQNGDVRICVDLTQLNKAVRREIHPMNSVDESLAKLAQSKIFTKLDAKSGFWQIPLSEKSRQYTTFITPFGRFQFNRLPFGISSASEVFQRSMSRILGDMEGIVCHMDDILIHAPDIETHNQRVRAVLTKLQKAGLTLNEKCEFSRDSVRFLGHVIDRNGIHMDPEKLKAIKEFPQPSNIHEVQRLLGMLNQLAKFTPNLASVTEPIRALLKKDTQWMWGHTQEHAFQQIKQLLLSPPVLAHYCTDKKKQLLQQMHQIQE